MERNNGDRSARPEPRRCWPNPPLYIYIAAVATPFSAQPIRYRGVHRHAHFVTKGAGLAGGARCTGGAGHGGFRSFGLVFEIWCEDICKRPSKNTFPSREKLSLPLHSKTVAQISIRRGSEPLHLHRCCRRGFNLGEKALHDPY